MFWNVFQAARKFFCIAPFIWAFFVSAGQEDTTYSRLDHSAISGKQENQEQDSVVALIPTFLGNAQRNYYGNDPPGNLEIKWKLFLGKGKTVISRKIGEKEWQGAGWTGQPLLIKEKQEYFLIQGAYDHQLKKIRASDGHIVWEYAFDDVIKGTGSIWHKPDYSEKHNRLVILQGSRLGVGNYLDSKHIPSYRAV